MLHYIPLAEIYVAVTTQYTPTYFVLAYVTF